MQNSPRETVVPFQNAFRLQQHNIILRSGLRSLLRPVPVKHAEDLAIDLREGLGYPDGVGNCHKVPFQLISAANREQQRVTSPLLPRVHNACMTSSMGIPWENPSGDSSSVAARFRDRL